MAAGLDTKSDAATSSNERMNAKTRLAAIPGGSAGTSRARTYACDPRRGCCAARSTLRIDGEQRHAHETDGEGHRDDHVRQHERNHVARQSVLREELQQRQPEDEPGQAQAAPGTIPAATSGRRTHAVAARWPPWCPAPWPRCPTPSATTRLTIAESTNSGRFANSTYHLKLSDGGGKTTKSVDVNDSMTMTSTGATEKTHARSTKIPSQRRADAGINGRRPRTCRLRAGGAGGRARRRR